MKNYFAFKQNVAGDCGILKYKPPCPPASDILRLYLASEVDARIADLEKALREAIEWNWMQDSVPTEVIEQVAAALGVPATEL